ncbi:MAG: NAD(P)H-binding protein [Novosphingobium sp.]|uniref:NAD(P)-dependent oxidoreductase n=1 Tax=Novosphingobium sp. TaxID=1874826 RepID=UPI0027346EF7|nr:NAD(P)H-binding protein [Novosphingobium sp.]MDP3549188.1 NAD(P)H-binding protein [Novosphingobium sp.]
MQRKVALLGATGFVGGHILTEALSRPELDITAVVRNPAALAAHDHLTTTAGDVFDVPALTEALRGHDTVIHAFHPGRTSSPDEVYDQSVAGHEAIIAATRAAGVPRLVCVGGAASLMTPEGKEYIDSSHWDKEFDPYRNSILGTRALYYMLKDVTDLDWVFLAPSAWLRPGERTGVFRTSANDMLFAADGTSRISLEDYSMVLIDEVVTPAHHRERFTVGY